MTGSMLQRRERIGVATKAIAELIVLLHDHYDVTITTAIGYVEVGCYQSVEDIKKIKRCENCSIHTANYVLTSGGWKGKKVCKICKKNYETTGLLK